MLKAVSLFSRKKTTRPFKDYYAEWIETLKNTLLPLLRRSLSSAASSPVNLLPTHVEMIHNHFQAYYDALDLAASHDAAQLLFPEWRNSLERPFLWFGDLHPHLFTNLLRSFLEDDDEDESGEIDDIRLQIGEVSELFGKPWQVVTAWKSPSRDLMGRIEQMECGLRLMVPALVARARNAQELFVKRVGVDWGSCEGMKEAARVAIEDAMAVKMDEMTSVLADANRLRKSVLADIMSATNVYQAALFLEALAQFLVWFRDREFLGEFERCKTPLN